MRVFPRVRDWLLVLLLGLISSREKAHFMIINTHPKQILPIWFVIGRCFPRLVRVTWLKPLVAARQKAALHFQKL